MGHFSSVTGEWIVGPEDNWLRVGDGKQSFDPLAGVLERAQRCLVGRMIRAAGDGRRRFYKCTGVEKADIEVDDGSIDGWGGVSVAGLRYHLKGRKPLELTIDVEIEVLL